MLETDAISKSGIDHLELLDNRIDRIEARAIQPAATVNTTVRNNTVRFAGLLWLNLANWQRVRIDANRFGTYNRALIAAQPANPIECTFRDNLITEPADVESLYFEYGQCAVQNVTFALPCICTALWPKKLFRNGPRDGQLRQINCAVDEAMRDCYNTTHVVWTEFQEDVCRKRTPVFVECERRWRTRMNISGFAAVDPAANTAAAWLHENWPRAALVAGGAAVLLLLLCAVCMACGRMKRAVRAARDRRDEEDANGGGGGLSMGDGENVTCSAQILTRCDATALAAREAHAFRTLAEPPMALLVMKSSKSFSIDDRVIIRQTLHDMKGRYEAQLYEQVYNNTMKVLNVSLAEPEKVAAIGEIIEALHECQKSGGDFVAFTDILYKQLVPHADGEEDHVYAECSTRGAAMQRNSENAIVAAAAAAAGTGGDHIYAEPQHLQLPLLTSEYAWPLDQDAPAYSEYAEPHRGKMMMILSVDSLSSL